MIDFLNGKVLEVTAFVRGASVLGAIVMVALAYYKARSLVAVLVAALTAGVFLWAINNTTGGPTGSRRRPTRSAATRWW